VLQIAQPDNPVSLHLADVPAPAIACRAIQEAEFLLERIERRHAILFAATLLCGRKLIESIESDKPNLAKQYFVANGRSSADVRQYDS